MTLEDFLDSLDDRIIDVENPYFKGFNDGVDETLDLIRDWIKQHKETIENEYTGEEITYVRVDK